MNRKLKLLFVVGTIFLGGALAYRQLDKSCASPNVHEQTHGGAEKTANKEGLAAYICEVAAWVGAGPSGPLATRQVGAVDHGERQEAAKSQEHGQEEAEAGEKTLVRLSPEKIQEFKIETQVAAAGPVNLHIERPAEVKFNRNKLAHIVPRVAGVVSRVEVSEGRRVEKGQLMAVLESRELADAKATYLAAVERRDLAKEAFVREERLWQQKVSAEKEYLTAKTELAEADINAASAEQKLRALGLPASTIKGLSRDDANLTEYKIMAPLSGTIIEQHLSLGEAVGTDRAVFVIADVSTVWVDVTIYTSDVASIMPGQKVQIDLDGEQPISGTIEFVTPEVKEATRTAVARLVLDNSAQRLRPGMFVTARLEIPQEPVPVRVARSAVQRLDKANVVFVERAGGFAPRPVELGRENHDYVEIAAGLRPGETYVSNGVFLLKSLMQKSQLGDAD